MAIETKQKNILECNYKQGIVNLNLKFDKDSPNHLDDIGNMIKILSTCKNDLVKYVEDNE